MGLQWSPPKSSQCLGVFEHIPLNSHNNDYNNDNLFQNVLSMGTKRFMK